MNVIDLFLNLTSVNQVVKSISNYTPPHHHPPPPFPHINTLHKLIVKITSPTWSLHLQFFFSLVMFAQTTKLQRRGTSDLLLMLTFDLIKKIRKIKPEACGAYKQRADNSIFLTFLIQFWVHTHVWKENEFLLDHKLAVMWNHECHR